MSKDYGKKLSAYVRRRTEPVKIEAENCPYERQTPKKGGVPIAGPGPTKDRFGRFPDQGEFEFNHERIVNMLYTIAVVLIILWLLGLVTSYTMGGFIHILLIIAIVVILLRVISGRSPL